MSGYSARSTSTTGWMLSGNASTSATAVSSSSGRVVSSRSDIGVHPNRHDVGHLDAFAHNFFLQEENSVEQCLRPRRATRYVHVHRDDLVDAVDDVVFTVVRAAVHRTAAHGQYPAWLGHLVIKNFNPVRHFFVDGTGYYH